MRAEKPAEGIMKTREFGRYKSYHVECECGSPECAHHLIVEADDMEVTVTIYLTLLTKWHNMSRWKQIWSILNKGYIDSKSTLVLNEQSALNYAATLKHAVKDVKELRDDRLQKKTD